MQDSKFIEDETIKDNCKMQYTFAFTGKEYKGNKEYKDDVVKQFMDLLKTDMYANEIEVVHSEIDNDNDRTVRLSISLYNGNISKSLIREAINKAS